MFNPQKIEFSKQLTKISSEIRSIELEKLNRAIDLILIKEGPSTSFNEILIHLQYKGFMMTPEVINLTKNCLTKRNH